MQDVAWGESVGAALSHWAYSAVSPNLLGAQAGYSHPQSVQAPSPFGMSRFRFPIQQNDLSRDLG